MRSGLPSLSTVAGAAGSLRAARAGFSAASAGVALFFGRIPALAEKPSLPPGPVFWSDLGLVSRTKVLPSPRFGLSFEFICCLPEA